LPEAEALRDQARGIEHVHAEAAAIGHVRAGHVERRDASVLGRGGLERVDHPLARREVAALRDVAGGVDMPHGRSHPVVDHDPLVDSRARALEERHVRMHAGRQDDEIGVERSRLHDQARAGLDTLGAALSDDLHHLRLQPPLQQAAADRRHHRPQDLTDASRDQGELHAALDQRPEAHSGDEPRAHHHDPRPGSEPRGDYARVLERPARDDAVETGARDRRQGRRGARRHEQTVVTEPRAVVELHRAAVLARPHIHRFAVEVGDAQPVEVRGVPALARTLLADATREDIGNRHPRVVFARLPAHQRDRRARVLFAKGFDGPDAGGSGADHDMVHTLALRCRMPAAQPGSASRPRKRSTGTAPE
jgi:hypothetical protein